MGTTIQPCQALNVGLCESEGMDFVSFYAFAYVTSHFSLKQHSLIALLLSRICNSVLYPPEHNLINFQNISALSSVRCYTIRVNVHKSFVHKYTIRYSINIVPDSRPETPKFDP